MTQFPFTTVNNNGLIDLQHGSIQLNGAGSSGGTFQVAQGTLLEFTTGEGNGSFTPTSVITGDGVAGLIVRIGMNIDHVEGGLGIK